MKQVDLGKTVYELCAEDPEILDLMKELGFTGITDPGMLHTVGRVMTIPKGARMKGLDLGEIRRKILGKGYSIKEG
ncbi:MAG: DUF1858 domain-containing protein [Clostridia bacterium]